MRNAIPALIIGLSLAACSKGDQQAAALDNAAAQSDPAAAAELRNQADAIRDNGADGNLSDPGSSAQDALQNAGNAAAANPVVSSQVKKPVDPQTGLTH